MTRWVVVSLGLPITSPDEGILSRQPVYEIDYVIKLIHAIILNLTAVLYLTDVNISDWL